MKLHYLGLTTLSRELDTNVASVERFAVIGSTLKRWGESALNWLLSGSEIKIYTMTERSGETRWVVFDPISRSRTVWCSEKEVRKHLENLCL
jgi:hypothetical protein